MKKIAILGLFIFILPFVYGQKFNWQNLDLHKDSVFGISVDKAYAALLKNKKSKTVLVAVIDSGIDTTHEDLRKILWINSKEENNAQDDDRNGYVDDLHGWNFIGGKAENVQFDNLELTRIFRRDRRFYDSLSYSTVSAAYQKKYQTYRKMKKEFDEKYQLAMSRAESVSRFKEVLERIVKKISKDKPVFEDFENYQSGDQDEEKVKGVLLKQLRIDPNYEAFKTKQVDATYNHFKEEVDYHLNINYDPRSIVGDDYNNSEERIYGNNDVQGPNADHGTHVAGIIGALRNNRIGINGVADNVQIMSLRIVPNGDERDKDVANAIRYAVDNGAKVINMSFGKPYSWDKKVVDNAVKYAMSKDVLLIHAAGNDGENLDDPNNIFFPTKHFEDSTGPAKAWIEVGASGWKDDSTLVASFSNYGKMTVDVFAPGVQIYSTIPGSKYDYHNGTSMAAPVVAGLAALIREYYPKLTAVQVKSIILQSVIKINHTVTVKDTTGKVQSLPFSDICISGGVVNAYNALKLAANYK